MFFVVLLLVVLVEPDSVMGCTDAEEPRQPIKIKVNPTFVARTDLFIAQISGLSVIRLLFNNVPVHPSDDDSHDYDFIVNIVYRGNKE
jgi:hypothetical protein